MEQEGKQVFCLRDPLEFALQPLVLGAEGLLVLSHLDGRHSIEQVRAALGRRFPGHRGRRKEEIPRPDQRSEGGFASWTTRWRLPALPRYAPSSRVRRSARRGTQGQPTRREPGELAAMLDRFLHRRPRPLRKGLAQARGVTPQTLRPSCVRTSNLRAGGATYPPAFTALAEAAAGSPPFELFVILGVAHNGGTEAGKSFAIATGKHYATPFGQVATNRRVIEDWSRRAGRGPHPAAVDAPHRALGGVSAAFSAVHPGAGGPAPLRGGPGSCWEASIPTCATARTRCGLRRWPTSWRPCGRRWLPAASAPSTCSAWTWLTSAPSSAIGNGWTMPPLPPASKPTATCWGAPNASMRPASPGSFTPTVTAARWTPSPDSTLSTTLLPGARCRGSLLSYGQNRQPDTGSLVSYASMAFYRTAPGSAPR